MRENCINIIHNLATPTSGQERVRWPVKMVCNFLILLYHIFNDIWSRLCLLSSQKSHSATAKKLVLGPCKRPYSILLPMPLTRNSTTTLTLTTHLHTPQHSRLWWGFQRWRQESVKSEASMIAAFKLICIS